MVVKTKRRRQDWLMAVLLFLTFGPCNGILYTMGVYQAYWVANLGLSPTEASFISSVLFLMTCIPSPLISIIIHKTAFKPNLMVALAIPLLSIGVVLNAYGTNFWVLLLASAVFLGPAQSIMDVTSMTAVYYYFVDEHVYLFTSIVSSGVGGGMIVFSVMFFVLEPSLGLKGIGYVQLSVAFGIFLAAIILFSCGERIGIVPKHRRSRIPKDRCEVCATNGLLVKRENCSCAVHAQVLHGSTEECLPSSSLIGQNRDNEAGLSCSLVVASRNTLYSDRSHLPMSKLMKSVFTNRRFLLILLSYACCTSVFNTVMYHQPTRLLAFGFSLENGAQSIAINGFVQMIFRVTAGVLSESNRVSPFRLSELSKLSLGLLTILSTFLPNLPCQLAYMFLIGVVGAFINTTDFLLVKDCMSEGREFGITLLFMIDGISTLLVDTLVGFLFQQWGDYNPIFKLMGSFSCVGSVLILISEIMHRRVLNSSSSLYETL